VRIGIIALGFLYLDILAPNKEIDIMSGVLIVLSLIVAFVQDIRELSR